MCNQLQLLLLLFAHSKGSRTLEGRGGESLAQTAERIYMIEALDIPAFILLILL